MRASELGNVAGRLVDSVGEAGRESVWRVEMFLQDLVAGEDLRRVSLPMVCQARSFDVTRTMRRDV